MTKQEHASVLRSDTQKHYNCCQAVLIPFCAATALEEETAYRLAAHFGSGMHHGSTCGAVTGGLMALGLMGASSKTVNLFLQCFKVKNGALTCKELQELHTGDKKSHCDSHVFDAIALAEALMGEELAKNG